MPAVIAVYSVWMRLETVKRLYCEIYSVSQRVTVLLCYSPAYLAPIRVTAPPTNMDVLEGDPVEITIGYRGNPKPTVTWYHNNIELVAPATQDSDPVALMGSHSLVLDVVMETNGGTYRAELVNSYGSDVATVSLNVSGEWCVYGVWCVCVV